MRHRCGESRGCGVAQPCLCGGNSGGEPGLSRVRWFCRDTMLQALRFVIQGAGAKVDVVIRKNIVSLLLSMLGHDEVPPQVDSGCTGWACFPSLGWCLCSRSRTWSGVIITADVRATLWFAPPLVVWETDT